VLEVGALCQAVACFSALVDLLTGALTASINECCCGVCKIEDDGEDND